MQTRFHHANFCGGYSSPCINSTVLAPPHDVRDAAAARAFFIFTWRSERLHPPETLYKAQNIVQNLILSVQSWKIRIFQRVNALAIIVPAFGD